MSITPWNDEMFAEIRSTFEDIEDDVWEYNSDDNYSSGDDTDDLSDSEW